MRISWWGCIIAAVAMMCWAAYQHVNQPLSPAVPPGASEQAEQRPLDPSPEQTIADKDDSRLQQADAAPQRIEEPVADKDDSRAQQADAASLRIEQPMAHKSDSRLQQADAAPADLQPDRLPEPQKEARLEVPVGSGAVERSEPSDAKPDLSYLHYYAYSELPPETKPADTVLAFLKNTPSGTPIEEIKRVADLLGMDFTFLKTIAKIESGFDPKQRTGSYIGLFQLSKYEFKKHGSGDILVARDNAVAAALKMMNEAVLFQMFTRRKATQFDLYLIHQQGIEGAAEHISHPNRLAWRSMCKTQEGKQKGERWCKLAIWGNTLPALKRTWKSVNNVTSGAFVAMWQQRVSHFYGRYSQTAVVN
jgi:hypothetical protein